MREMGFADHLPFLGGWKPKGVSADGWAMALGELDGYAATVLDLAAEYRSDIRILLGIEADYIEETLEETARVLREYPFDYVIGSVHIVGDGFAFDHPEQRHRLPEYGIDRIFLESFELVARAADSGLFRVMGHIDQAKKFGYRPDDEASVAAAASRALRAIKRAGAAVEINTAGWRKPVGEAYPARDLLTEAAELDIPLTLGSDAHRPEEVGAGFERAAALAREAGYAAVLCLSRGAPESLP
jgi:histidinol-phosphatase (PHP family)